MNKLKIIAENIFMGAIWFTVINNLITFMPLYINNYIIFDFNKKKIYFTFTLFNFNILGGYVTFNDMKINIHISENIVFIIDIFDDIKNGKNLIEIKHIELFKFKSLLKFNEKNDALIYFSAFWWNLTQNISPIIKNKKDFIKIRNDIMFTDCDSVEFYLKTSFITNIFSLNMLLVNNIFKRVMEYVRRKKQS